MRNLATLSLGGEKKRELENEMNEIKTWSFIFQLWNVTYRFSHSKYLLHQAKLCAEVAQNQYST